MKRLWHDRSLGIVLALLFLSTWVFQAWAGWEEFQADQTEHGGSAALFGQSGYIWVFARSTLENWQSEFLQLLTFVVLTSFLVFRGSPESRDDKDETMAAFARIEQRLDELAKR